MFDSLRFTSDTAEHVVSVVNAESRVFFHQVAAIRGAFSISDEDAAAAALEFIDERRLTGAGEAPVVVYGGTLTSNTGCTLGHTQYTVE